MGKAKESLKDKGAVVFVFPADYFHKSSPTLECSHSGTEVLFTHFTLLARINVANLSSWNTTTCCPTCPVSPRLLRATLTGKFASYSLQVCLQLIHCPSWPEHSVAFAQQTNLPGHAGWLLRARRCSVGVPSCHCPARLNPKPPLSVPDTSLGSRPCAKACPSSLGSSLLPVHPTFQRLHHFSVPTSLSPASQHTRRHTSFQHDTSDAPAAMQALKSNAVQNCTRFPGDWECTGFEERHPLISPGSFSHGAHLTAALPYFVLQLQRIARRDLEEPLQNTKCSGVLVSLPK